MQKILEIFEKDFTTDSTKFWEKMIAAKTLIKNVCTWAYGDGFLKLIKLSRRSQSSIIKKF